MPLFPAPGAEPLYNPPAATYDALFDGRPALASQPMSIPSIGFFLRHALGLSAWKAFAKSRWSLRVNPSSGNLHPTEAYVVHGGWVWHYDSEHHALEQRIALDSAATIEAGVDPGHSCLVALTSIHWRESWKYGERAFRYCHHDVGHAIGALRLSAALCGWRLSLLPGFSHTQLATLTGTDRDEDFVDAEREDPACVMMVTSVANAMVPTGAADVLAAAARRGRWTGRASQLSEDHVQWTFIDEAAQATAGAVIADQSFRRAPRLPATLDRGIDAAALILQRRSAVALDRVTTIDRRAFLGMLARVLPTDGPPWDALWWRPRIHLALFVHRVTGLEPGLYLLARDPGASALLRSALSPDAKWQQVTGELPLWQLATGDWQRLAQRVSCDQEIAGDGCFSLAMLADFAGSLDEHGASFYRQLFWECGLIGQVLYLEAEAAGIRSTGIGCFYDDAVHDALGIRDHALQSLYHFTVGGPVEDTRLTTEPGYAWGR